MLDGDDQHHLSCWTDAGQKHGESGKVCTGVKNLTLEGECMQVPVDLHGARKTLVLP